MSANWYAYRVVSQHEQRAAQILRDRYRLNAWCPTEKRYLRLRGRATKQREKQYALLVGYILVQTDQWWEPLDHGSVLACIGIGGEPRPIAPAAIEKIRQLSGHHLANVASVNMRRSFSPGDLVRVTSGPLAGYEGKVQEVKGAKATMLLQFLGRETVAVPLEKLEAA